MLEMCPIEVRVMTWSALPTEFQWKQLNEAEYSHQLMDEKRTPNKRQNEKFGFSLFLYLLFILVRMLWSQLILRSTIRSFAFWCCQILFHWEYFYTIMNLTHSDCFAPTPMPHSTAAKAKMLHTHRCFECSWPNVWGVCVWTSATFDFKTGQ